MGEVKRTTEEIRQEIERIRENLVDHVAALEVTFKEKLDWRRPIRERPRVYLGGALLLGVAIGLL